MRLSIDLPDEMHRALKAKAATEGRTVSDLVREIIRKYLDGNYTVGVSTTKLPQEEPTTSPSFRPISKADQAKGRSRR